MVPIEVVATRDPFAFAMMSVFARLEIANVVEVALVRVVLPEKVLWSERRVVEADDPLVIQVPFTEKQPLVRLIPLAKVELAVVEVAENTSAAIVLYAVIVPRKSDEPNTSNMLPVVEVAVAPSKRTLDMVEG